MENVVSSREGVDELIEGRKVFDDWVSAMAKAGDPLPPGGDCVVSKWSILRHGLEDLRVELAESLGVSQADIAYEFDHDPNTNMIRPRVNIELPDDLPGKEGEVWAKKIVDTLYHAYMGQIRESIDRLPGGPTRPDLYQDIIVEGFRGSAPKN